jgi:peptide deformylase
MTKKYSPEDLPDYVVINDPACQHKEVLTTPTEKVTFPLDEETKEIIRQLEAKFDQAEDMAGLAANQIGFNKRIFIFAAPEDERIQALGPDFEDTFPRTIWINPSYKPLKDEMWEDWEGCFSVADLVGRVPRYRYISYEAWTPEGKKVTGTAKGYVARIIQHEVGHLNGQLYIDITPKEYVMTREELYRNRGLS